jgi:AcrR family transcriptional regulator
MTSGATETAPYPRTGATQQQELTEMQLRLLDAAAAAFLERGYDATSIDDIGRAVGATKGAVYYSYRSKIELFMGVYERGMLLLEERVARALEQVVGAGAEERLRAVNVAHAENIMVHFAYHVVIQQGVEHRRQMPLRERDRARLGDLDHMRHQHEALVISLIEDGIRDGTVRSMPIRLATRTLIGGVVGLAVWYRPREDQSDEDRRILAEQIVDVLLAGVLAGNPGASTA